MNKNVNCVFKRVEKKYLLNDETYHKLMESMLAHIKADEYGCHTICNIYYDTESSELIRNSIQKPPYKEKLRLRSYGIPNKESTVFLEIKKKYKGTVYKRRISITLGEAEAFLKQGKKPEEDSQILREIDYFISFYHTEPKLYLAYDRIAYVGIEDENIRITFDKNIRSRTSSLRLDAGDMGELLLDESYHLMEIKVPSAMPVWMVKILSDLEVYPTSFSKYGNVYTSNLLRQKKSADPFIGDSNDNEKEALKQRGTHLCLQQY